MVPILTFIIIFLIVAFIFGDLNSKSSSRKERLKEGIGEISSLTGSLAMGLGDRLKESSVENQIIKLGLESNYSLSYQNYNRQLTIYSQIKDNYAFKKSQMTEKLKLKLIEEAKVNDDALKNEIQNSRILYKKCKDLNVSSLAVIGSDIRLSDSTEYIKKGELLEVFKIGLYGFQKKNNVI